MFFTKLDRELLNSIWYNQQSLFSILESTVIVEQHILERLNKMPTRKELDAALESENEALQAAAERTQKAIADKTAALQDALNNLQAKHDGDEDFSAELAQVNQHVADLNQIAQTPLAASGQTPATSPSTATGAAGSTVGGAEMNAAAEAAGAEAPASDDHAGSATTPHDPNAGDKTTPTIEWGSGENAGRVRDLPDGDWRSATQEEIDAKGK